MSDRHLRPEPPEAVHWDVAAYALGVLDPGEIDRCEQHLAECSTCAAELERLLPVSTLLADVEPNALRELDDPALLDRLTCAVHADRRRARRRRRLVAAVATVAAAVLTGVALFAGAYLLDPVVERPSAEGSPAPGPTGTGGGAATPEPDDVRAVTDPDSGVRAELALSDRDWGTLVSLELSGVSGPLECRLVLVRSDGTGEVAGGWRVPVEGYGTPQQPRPLTVRAAVASPRDELSRMEITVVGPDAPVDPLVTVPL